MSLTSLVPTKLVKPSVPGAAKTMSPATDRETTEGHVDVALQSLTSQSILSELGYVVEEGVTATWRSISILTNDYLQKKSQHIKQKITHQFMSY